MDTTETALPADCADAPDTPHELSPGHRAVAESAIRNVEFVLGVMDRARERNRVLIELGIAVRLCDSYVRNAIARVADEVHHNPNEAVPLLRKAAERLKRMIDLSATSQGDPDVVRLCTEIRDSMARDGITIDSLRIAINALKLAAIQLEGC